ncbi:uncharacterized protein LOC111889543 [Lactuca sativa]|uniref:uncharacterized protein LOC111889543 n=1 Tax=Lactuca sativa TaxID=4236 RepID=UPI0022AEC218|nr:uncharacterized protein LOC111889543 [Lactuca sativa]
MDKYHVPTMATSPLSSIGVFHTTKIIVTDPSKFIFVGSIPESMYACVSEESHIIKTYKEFLPSGPRELTVEMLQSINDTDKPVTTGKKPEKWKGKKVVKGEKGHTPKKRKSKKAAQSPPPKKKKKKTQPKRKLVLASSSSESEDESLDSEGSIRGDSHPRSTSHEHIGELHEKIDNLIASSSSSRSHISEAAIQGMVDTFTKAHEASINSVIVAIDASTKACAATTEKVEKLFRDDTLVLESLQGAAESNATKVNSVVEKLATSFETKQHHFASLRQTLEADNKSFQTTVDDRLTKLQEDLATENSVMDALARKTTALKTKSLQLSQTEKEVDYLRSERAVIKSCVSDVHGALSNIIEAHDPILNYSVRRTLAEKLASALAMLSRIEGLPEPVVHPKQGGEGASKDSNQSQPPPVSTAQSQPPPISSSVPTKATEPPTTGHASGSGTQDKGKKVLDDSDGDKDKETIANILKKQARDKDLYMNARMNMAVGGGGGGDGRGSRGSDSDGISGGCGGRGSGGSNCENGGGGDGGNGGRWQRC